MRLRICSLSVTSLLLTQISAAFAVQPAFDNATSLLENADPGVTVSENRGLAWIDYDNDGWQDLYVVDLDGSGRLYHNLGDPEADGHNGFELAVNTNTELTGLETLGAVAGDYNNDGYDDLFVSGFLLENQQDGTFQDVTAAKGLNVTGNCNLGAAAFGDVDSDGDLDLYAGSFSFASHCNYFFKNNGQGTGYSFTESSSQAGLGQSSAEATWAVVMTDYDNDRDLDIYIVNDFSLPNRLYENDGSGNFTFLSNGSDIRVNAMGVAVGDYDVDGDFDFFVTNVTSRNPSNTNLKNKLLRNDGASGFSEVATLAGVLGNERMPAHTGSSIYWGASFLDVDNDGYLDLYAANNPMSGTLPELNKQNRLYINDGDVNADGVAEGTFTEAILPVVNVEPGHGVARADYDNDGRMDIAVHGKSVDGGINGVMLLHNVTPQNNQWLKLRLVNESNSNARGIGAKIRLTSNDPGVANSTLVQLREVRAGGSHSSSHEFPVLFGIPANSVVERLEIEWPGGQTQIFTGKGLAPLGSLNRTLTVFAGELK